MNYPEFNVLSIISALLSVASVYILVLFVKNTDSRIKKVESKISELISSFNNLHGSVRERIGVRKKEKQIEYMEGDMDLIMSGKRASFKAIYYPKKIKKKDRNA